MNLVMNFVVVSMVMFVTFAQSNDLLDNVTDGEWTIPAGGGISGAIPEMKPVALRVDEGNDEDEFNETLNVNEIFDFDTNTLEERHTSTKSFKIFEHKFDATPIEDQGEILKLERDANVMAMEDISNTTRERELSTCVSFDTMPRNPGTAIKEVNKPWSEENRKTCKMFMKWSDGSSGVCSASLIGPNHILTSTHCTMNACSGGMAIKVYVKCGYGYVPFANDYATLGTAYVTRCTQYEAFNSNVQCVDGKNVGPFEWDIQVCQIDRSLLHSHGHYAVASSSADQLQVRGYPSNTALDSFIPSATSKQFWRSVVSQAVSPFQFRLNGAWTFAGESGCPYYINAVVSGTNSLQTAVIAVHNGGETGCYARGRRIDSNFMEKIRTAFTTQESTRDWCNVIEDRANLQNAYTGRMKGLQTTDGSFSSFATVYPGQSLSSKFPLINVGTKNSGTVNIEYFAVEGVNADGESKLLGLKKVVNIHGWSTKMITKEISSLNTLSLTPGKVYSIVAKWSQFCMTSGDVTTTTVAWLEMKKRPFGNRCTSDDMCESNNCHNGSCCHKSEKTKRCEACHAETGLCAQCEGYYALPGCSGCLNTAYRPLLTTKCVQKKSLGASCNLVSRNYGNSQCKSGYCERNGPLSLRGTCATE